jgi:wyosine [tRNA(Phe)-imidazoG37] synthetase (radical SAM superfamily)
LKINVDQFALDTRLRKWRWSWYKQHPVFFLINRVQWYLYPTLKYVSKFPIHIDFEAASICNLKCPMCYRPHRADHNDGVMDFSIFQKAIDECVEYGLYSIRLSWRGEPTLNPNIVDMVKYAKKKGIKEVSFITNGTQLKGRLAKGLVRAGLDYFSVSIDGTDQRYEKIRYPSKFSEILEKLKQVRSLRDKTGRGFPRIRINSIWSAIEHDPDEYFRIFSPIVDFITINPDYNHSLKETAIDPNHQCQYLYQRMTVMWDGTVPLCICDKSKEVILGSFPEYSLYNMWHGAVMTDMRNRQVEGKIKTIAPCTKCQRSLTEQIGDRRPGRRRK